MLRRTPLRLADLGAAARLAALESLVADAVGSESMVKAVADRQVLLESMTHGLGQQLTAAQQQGQSLAQQTASAEAMLAELAGKSTAADAMLEDLGTLARSLALAQKAADDVHRSLARDTEAVASTQEALAKRVEEQRVHLRRATAPVPAVAVVVGSVSLDVTLAWSAGAFPTTAKTIEVMPPVLTTGNATLLGKAGARVKSSSASGCVVTVTTTAVLAAGALQLDVLAYAP